MANTAFYNGFNQYSGNGSAPTFEQIQMAISSSDTRPLFFGDPVVQAGATSGTLGAPTGFVTQAYGPVALTVAAGGVTVVSGAPTITWSAAAVAGGNTALPTGWVPPVGSQIVVSGSTPSTVNGVYVVASNTSGVATCLPAANITGPSTAIGSVTVYVPIAGIFTGCEYLSTAAQRMVWQRWWPGTTDAATNALAWVVNDPNAVWEVQAGLSTGTMVNPAAYNTATGQPNGIGQCIGFAFAAGNGTSGNGNTANFLSTAYVDANTLQGANPPSAPQLLPFRVLGLKNYQANGNNPLQSINGNDFTSPYNRLVVGFNNSMNRQLFGI